MKFPVEDKLTEEEIQFGLKAVVNDGLASQAMVTLTGGAFLIAFALKLGASNAVIGLLAAIPPLTQLLQIPSIYSTFYGRVTVQLVQTIKIGFY